MFIRVSGQLVINNLRQAVFKSVIHQDMNFFGKNKVGEIVSRLSTDALIVGQSVSSNLTVGTRAFMSFVGSAVIMVRFTHRYNYLYSNYAFNSAGWNIV